RPAPVPAARCSSWRRAARMRLPPRLERPERSRSTFPGARKGSGNGDEDPAMVTADELAARAELIRESADLSGLLRRIRTRSGRRFSGVGHHRHWARFQHLWVAEQAAELATIGTLGDDPDAIRAATQLLLGYAHYTSLPNSDNVLGPSRLFFSTYLDSIWIT